MASARDSIALGRAALSEARWAHARGCFEAASALEPDSAEVLDGLSEARWWLGEWHESRELRERAFARHRASGARAEAARAAIWLANEYLLAAGNRAAWNGWLERAAGLLEGLEPCVEHGWLWFSRGRLLDDPTQMAISCGEALELARRLGDVDASVTWTWKSWR
jgi:tetratricopeptide (TPR) repeat protein